MPAYQKAPVQYKPEREMLLASPGVILASTVARYDTLAEYIWQFAAPLSTLYTGEIGLLSFADPLWPECSILLQCTREPWCARCDRSVEACQCQF